MYRGHSCDRCGEFFADQDLYQVRQCPGKNYCGSCKSLIEGETCCVRCGRSVSYIEGYEQSGGFYCSECFDILFPSGQFYQ